MSEKVTFGTSGPSAPASQVTFGISDLSESISRIKVYILLNSTVYTHGVYSPRDNLEEVENHLGEIECYRMKIGRKYMGFSFKKAQLERVRECLTSFEVEEIDFRDFKGPEWTRLSSSSRVD